MQATPAARREEFFLFHEKQKRRAEIRPGFQRRGIDRQQHFHFLLGGDRERVGFHRHHPRGVISRHRFQLDLVSLDRPSGFGDLDGALSGLLDLCRMDSVAGCKTPRAIKQHANAEADILRVADGLHFVLTREDRLVMILAHANVGIAGAELLGGTQRHIG